MPMPLWVGHINKRIFNPREIRKGKRPVLTHLGRSSGTTYHTPLDAHAIDGGYIFILMYGSSSDWVQNVLASGTATLRIDSGDVDLANPRVVTHDVAKQLLPPDTQWPPDFLKVTEYLQMDTQR